MAMRPLDRLPTVRAKLGSVIVFAVAATIVCIYLAVGLSLRPQQDRKFRQLFGEAKTIAALGFTADGRPSGALKRATDELTDPLVVVDRSGQKLVGNMDIPPTVSNALSGRTSLDIGRIGNREYVGLPVTRQGQVVGAVYLAHPVGGGFIGAVDGIGEFISLYWKQLLVAGAIAAFIALALARILARGMTQPLRDMSAAAGRMSRGDYSRRVPVSSRDEVGQLAEAFNHMAGEMANLERLRRDLVANVSHELKTPISALRAHLENLLDGVEEPNPAVLQLMLQQSERLSRLVDQLLDLSKMESGDVPLDLHPVRLRPLVDRVLQEVRLSRADGAVEARNKVPADLPPITADPERLHQVLFNLLDNAFRFTPDGGQVWVSASEEDRGYEVVVGDTGPGIPAEHLPFVFERFYRVDPSRSRGDGGTGIGLAIARSVVEAHGGRIWAESRVGEGCAFRFVLPRAGPSEPPVPPSRTLETAAPRPLQVQERLTPAAKA